jgi:pimeloyl-ACP methyl ester carboxylesterase
MVQTDQSPGIPVSLEPIGRYPHALLRALFWRRGLARVLPTEHGIALHRLVYWTSSPDNECVRASGLIALPRGRGRLRGIVSWQHGTESLRTESPSAKHVFHGLLPAAVFAGHGYMLIAPDYLGYGVSDREHDYHLADNMAIVVRDCIRAAATAISQRGTAVPARLFLSGFSEGGHAAIATHRLVESAPIAGLRLMGSAPVAAAGDLAEAGLAGALAGGSRYCSLYVAWLATTYARHYREPLESVLVPHWADVAHSLFDGSHDGEETVAALPPQPREMLDPDFLARYERNADHWFLARLRENSLLDWAPQAPMRVYYGTKDADVLPLQAELLERHLRSRGGDCTAVCVGDADHDGTTLHAAPLLRNWFDELAELPN